MSLNLPDSPRKIVFRTIVSLFQQDPDLQRTIRPSSWFIWDGSLTALMPYTSPGIMPSVMITPTALAASPETQSQQNSPMGIQLNVATSGLNVDDLLDLWSAFERVIFKGDGGALLQQQMQSLFMHNTGCDGSRFIQVRLGMPAVTLSEADAEERFMVATGMLHVDMLVRK